MKTFTLSVTIVVALSLLFSCKPKPEIEVLETDYRNKSEITVEGVPVDIEMPLSVHGMFHIDSLNIVLTEDPRGYVFVYSDSWELLDIFAQKGRARNEFLDYPSWNSGQIFKGADGHVLLPLSDRRARSIKLMDITESLASHRAVITDSRYFEFDDLTTIEEDNRYVRLASSFTFLYLDDNIHHTVETTEADFYDILHNPIEYRIRYDTAFIEKPGILTDMERLVGPNRQSNFMRSHYRHPKRNLIIELFMYNDYIAFLDLDNNKSFFVHQKDAITFDQEIETKVIEQDGDSFTVPAFLKFNGAVLTDSFFMASYYDVTLDQTDVKPQLLFFDWDGNFIKSVRLSKATNYNVYDPKTKTLYGIDRRSDDEPLISFDLSSIIDW